MKFAYDPNKKNIVETYIDKKVDEKMGEVQEMAKQQAEATLDGWLEAAQEFIVEASYSIALIGGGLCIIFKVAGWQGGYKWASILSVSYVLIKYLLG
jgi:hypothetical protein